MKKVLSLIFLLAVMLTLFSGCHKAKSAAAFEVPDTFDETKHYDITFWAKNDTNVTQTKIYKSAIDEFQKIYPNITVTLKLYTDYGKIYEDVITNISTGTTPNVCITYPDHIATYLTGENTVVPLDDLLTDKKYGAGGSEVKFDAPKKNEIIEKYLDECRLSGAVYAVPFMRSTEALYMNKTFIEKLGFTIPEKITWDFVWEVSEAAMAKDSDGNFMINGQKVMIPFIYKSTDNMMIQLLKQSGAGYSDEAGNILLFNDTTKGHLETIASHVATGAFSTFKISSYPANFLNAGRCIFAIDSTAGSTWMGAEAPLSDICSDDIVPFETAVAILPQIDTENPKMISQGPSVCIFNKDDSGEVLASWLFTQYLLTNSVQTAYAKTEGYIPVTEKAQNSEEYLDYLSREGEDNNVYYGIKIKASKLLLANIENTFITPVFNGSASLRDAAGQLIESTARSVKRKEAITDKYFEKLYSDTTSLYRLDSISASGAVKAELGELPAMSKGLLISLGSIWIAIGIYVLAENIKKKKKS